MRCTLSVHMYSDRDYTRTVISSVGLRDHGSQQPPSTDHKLSPEVLTLSIKYEMSAVTASIGTHKELGQLCDAKNTGKILRVLLSQREYCAS